MPRTATLLSALVLIGACCTNQASAQDRQYQLGLGQEISDWLTVGGYFSTEYVNSDQTEELLLDDLALLFYGDFGERLSYLVELESVEPWVSDLKNDTTSTNFPPTIERLYVDYKFSDNLAVRVGKQISPIGYWNLQPINVLRETTSNPLYSQQMFPKFLTGVDVYGYAPFASGLTYHVYAQNSRDMDENNINITIDRHIGVALEKEFSQQWHGGLSAGRYDETDNTRVRYFQLNARYDYDRLSLISEASVNLRKYPGGQFRSSAFYLQGEYHFNPQHALIARSEYLRDPLQARQRTGISILGYSYRPVYPVSLKLEYQWHRHTDDNRLMASFSVLF